MSSRRVRQAIAGLLATALLFSSGCWDFRQLNERAFVLMLGIDRASDGKGYRVTTQKIIGQYLTGAQAGTGGGQQRRPYIIRDAEAGSVMQAIEKIRMGVHRDLEFSHLKVIVLSEEVAKTDDLEKFEYLARSLKVPNTAYFTVARGQAAEMVSAPNQAEDLPALYLYHGYTGRYARTQAILSIPIWFALTRAGTTFLQDVAAGGIGLDKGEVNFAGSGVWSGRRFAGWLTPFETKLISFYLKLKQVDDFLVSPTSEASMRIGMASGGYWADWDPDGTVVLHISATVKGDLLGSSEPVITLEDQARVNAVLAKTVKNNIEDFMHHLQELGSDPLGFGEKLREVDSTAPEVQDFAAWHEAYKKARVQVDTKAVIYNRGYVR